MVLGKLIPSPVRVQGERGKAERDIPGDSESGIKMSLSTYFMDWG